MTLATRAVDDEGYSCALGALDFWVIVDRYGGVQEQYPACDDYREARAFADRLNDEVIARRFGRPAPASEPVKVPKRVGATPRKAPPPLPAFEDVLATLQLF